MGPESVRFLQVTSYGNCLVSRTVRLVAHEPQEQREVYISRTNSNTLVANVICSADSGELVKVTLWGEHVADFYEMFQPGHVSFDLCGPSLFRS